MSYSSFTTPKNELDKSRGGGYRGSAPSDSKATEKQHCSKESHRLSPWKFGPDPNKLFAGLHFRIPRYHKHENDPEKGRQMVVIEGKRKEAEK